MTDPKYTRPDDEGFHMTFPQYPDPSVSKKPVNITITTANTTGDYPPIEATLIDQLCRAEAIVRDLAALKELDDLRELNNPEGREKFRQLIERANRLIER